MIDLRERVTDAFRQRHGGPPAFVVRAPGRVNLIGEHTDYNEGFVLPLAIDRATWIACRPRADRLVNLYSLDHEAQLEVALDSVAALGLSAEGAPKADERGRGQRPRLEWTEYPKGVAWSLQQAGYGLQGWDGVTACDVPLGGGLSSSASFELAVARVFQAVSRFPWDNSAMARLCQRAENQWVGVNCGIMDQMICAAGRAGHALLIDCRSLETTAVPLPPAMVVAILDTGTRHKLSRSAYNERRAQCETAAERFGVRALRDVSPEEFTRRGPELDALTRRRARHVIGENARVQAAVAAMQRGDAGALGRLIDESHRSLRDDYEVSSAELNVFVECARILPGCAGARMTGAGFGGCAVALVRADLAAGFVRKVAAAYHQKTGIQPAAFICRASNGAELMPA